VIAAACDLRIAAELRASASSFPKVGLCGADMGASFLLPRIVGRGRAAELLFFGRVVSAADADRMGFLNRVLPVDEVLPEAMAWARELARGPAFAHTMTKQMLESEWTMPLASAIEAEAQAQAICMAHPDFKTAYEANKKKETPRFEGAPAAPVGAGS
jgi:enoyl-CoA hydratase/carnithine racemase